METRALVSFTVLLAASTTAVGAGAEDEASPKLRQYFRALELVARREEEIPLHKYSEDKFTQEIYRSQRLAETGKYAEAAAVLAALMAPKMSSDWKSMLSARIAVLRKWAKSGTIELSDYRRFYVDTGPQWFNKRARPIVTLWKMKEVDEAEKYRLLRILVERRGDNDGLKLLLQATAASPRVLREDASGSMLDLGNLHYRLREYDRAEQSWLKLKNQFPLSTAWPRAVFNLGLLSKKRGNFPVAIQYFGELVRADVNDLELGRYIMDTYRNYRPRAQWEIGHCFLAQKEYEKALAAYRRAEREFSIRTWCGNERAEYRYLYAFYQGLCHEWLGHRTAAVKLYYKAIVDSHGLYFDPQAHFRIVDLYQSAGQMGDLNQILDAVDERFIAGTRKGLQGYGQPDREQLTKMSSTACMRRILELRNTALRRKWASHISQLRVRGTVTGPYEADARKGNWMAVEAARLLAGHAEETVPLIVAKMKTADRQDVKWLWYALGVCGTPQAIQELKASALKESNIWWTKSVVYALSLAGQQGEAALNDLEKMAKGHLKRCIQDYRKGRLEEGGKGVAFPPLPRRPCLPRTLQALEAAVSR